MTTRAIPALRPADFDALRIGADILLVRDMVLDANIGVDARERGGQQRLCLNIEAAVDPPSDPLADNPRQVVSYHPFVEAARRCVAERDTILLENLAERLAGAILANPRVRVVRIRIEKLDIFGDCAAVGVAVERARR